MELAEEQLAEERVSGGARGGAERRRSCSWVAAELAEECSRSCSWVAAEKLLLFELALVGEDERGERRCCVQAVKGKVAVLLEVAALLLEVAEC